MGRKIKGMGYVVGPILPYFMSLFWPLAWIHKMVLADKSRKRILLVTRNNIAANYMADVSQLLREDADIVLFVATDRVPSSGFSGQQASAVTGVPFLHIFKALIVHWDLIIYTNHAYGFGVCFPPNARKIYINHGIHMGKINNALGEDGVYGRGKVIRPFASPYYDMMFAASAYERDFAIECTPELDGHIMVTGCLRADLYAEYVESSRLYVRERLGLTPREQVVHIISTWGHSSLCVQFGDMVLKSVRRLSGKYRFIVSIHPRYDDLTKDPNHSSRDDILSRFEAAGVIVNRGIDWEDYVLAADIAISDHSSLVLYHVLLSHPLILVDLQASEYMDGSTFDLLKSKARLLSGEESLEDALSDVCELDVSFEYSEIVDNMLNCRGNARVRYLREISRLLNMS